METISSLVVLPGLEETCLHLGRSRESHFRPHVSAVWPSGGTRGHLVSATNQPQERTTMKVTIMRTSDTEQWKDITGYEGFYQISNWGRVKSLPRWVRGVYNSKQYRKGGVLQPILDRDGYHFVNLSKNGNMQSIRVHRLVLMTFIGHCPEGMECRHFPDRDVTNNHLENLSWGTKEQNTKDRTTHGTERFGERHHNCKLTVAKVRRIRKLYTQGWSYKQLASKFRVDWTNIRCVVRRRTWKHVA